ncbi:MAG: hypothetical protein ABI690_14985 [Chloroflexota bacterium]
MAGNDQAIIEKEWVQSWDSVIYFFTRINANHQCRKPLLDLIAELRARGYDRQLLAAQSMLTLIFRRHRGHRGLPNGKPTLSINPNSNRSFTIHYSGRDGEVTMEIEQLEFTPDLEILLKRLVAHPIEKDQPTDEKWFLSSWDRTEESYKSRKFPASLSASMLSLIAELRQRGYDRRLFSNCVGVTGTFALSPVSFGISHHDAYLFIYLKQNSGMDLYYHDGAGTRIRTECDHFAFTPELEALLERLAAHPID